MIRKKTTFALVAIAAVFGGMSFAKNEIFSDQDVKADIEYYCSLRHPQDFGSLVERAFAKSGSDNDRFSRILGEFAIENYGLKNGLASRWAIDKIAQYGTTNSLPFLYSCATNPVCGDCAIKSIIAIEGVTSNSIAAAQSYLSNTNAFSSETEERYAEVCKQIVTSTFGSDSYLAYRPCVLAAALDFARNVNTMNVGVDGALIQADPTYRFSKRRLSVMRGAQLRLVNEVQSNYVSNAINELVAYPEAELPD